MRRIFADHPLTSSEKNKRDYERNGDKRRKRNKEYHKLHKEEIRIRHRCNQHGVTQEWVNAQLLKQDNKCAICGCEFVKTPHIDHNHACCPPKNYNKSCDKCRRGLLCEDCNLGLGRFKDDTTVLANAIQYVNSYKKEQ